MNLEALIVSKSHFFVKRFYANKESELSSFFLWNIVSKILLILLFTTNRKYDTINI